MQAINIYMIKAVMCPTMQYAHLLCASFSDAPLNARMWENAAVPVQY